MEKYVVIESADGITTGTTSEDVAVGQIATIKVLPENGGFIEVTGKVIDIL